MNSVHSEKSRRDYIERINTVIDYIEEHYQEELSLERIAGVACFSPFHFHRVFSGIMGETVSGYIQRTRLEKAAHQLLQDKAKAVTQIALDCGFASSASFANSFKNRFKTSPSAYKKEHSLVDNHYVTPPYERLESVTVRFRVESSRQFFEVSGQEYERRVSLCNLPQLEYAYVRYIGPYKGDALLFHSLWEKLAKWAAPRGLFENPESRFISIYYDNPEITAEEKLKVNVCVSIDSSIKTGGEVGRMKMGSV